VQLRALTDPEGEVFVGRVEHIASGTAVRFASAAELTAFIAQIGGAPSRSTASCSHGGVLAACAPAGEDK
jgi:hypothetical protein